MKTEKVVPLTASSSTSVLNMTSTSQVKISHAINGNLPFKDQRIYEYNAEKESDSYTGDMARKVVPLPSTAPNS